MTLGTAVGGRAAQATLLCPPAVRAGQQFATGLTIDVGTKALGAYSITVVYDPAVLTIAAVNGGDATEFSAKPATKAPTPGMTNIAAFQSSSLTSPTGVVNVAKVTFNVAPVASATTSIGLDIVNLFDTDAVQILPAMANRCSVRVMRAQ